MSIQTSILSSDEIPLSKIRRPIPPVLDYQKIDAMFSTLNGIPMASKTCTLEEATNLNKELPPIDVMVVKENSQIYYFSFGGCHRFQAYERLSKERGNDVMVRCKLIPATRNQLKLYLGSSLDDLFV